jgi:AcrR family transcriptional regulator
VAADQRLRILEAVAETMAEKGYVAATVADVLARAGVSRETFYQQFTSKQDAFLAAFDVAGEIALQSLARGWDDALVASGATPLERFDAALAAYLDTLVARPAFARTFLVEVYAAGPEAIARRAAFQARVVDAMVDRLGFGESRRFACEVVVAATASLVTPLLVAGDLDAVGELRAPLVDALRRLVA